MEVELLCLAEDYHVFKTRQTETGVVLTLGEA